MSLALHYCWKEWRAQRGLLSAYLVLVLACTMCGFLQVPDEFWQREGNRAQALGWFLCAGVIGVLLFAAPQLVRGEFAAREDTFVRRLPGALAPSFWGKLLFLVLATAALPLVGLLAGEWFLQATGHFWDDLFFVWPQGRGEVAIGLRWPTTFVFGVCALLAVPWIWALATWLPGGRMALGGATLLILLLALGVSAVLRQCPRLEQVMAWRPWLWEVVPLGLAVAAVSWVRGRRGGGNYRSARFGLATLAIGLLPPATWLGTQVFEYRHPDLTHPKELRIEGLSPDLRYAIGSGTSHPEWVGVPLRIDLQTGAVEQIGSIHTELGGEVVRPYRLVSHPRQRYWRLDEWGSGRHTLFDLATGARVPAAFDKATGQIELPAELRGGIEAESRVTTPFHAPGGRSAFVAGGMLHIEQTDGTIRQTPWPKEPRLLFPSGHGIIAHSSSGVALFDLTRERFVTPPGSTRWTGIAVSGRWLLHHGQQRADDWKLLDPDRATLEACPELKGTELLSLLNDHEALFIRNRSKNAPAELLAYRPADRRSVALTLPQELSGPGAVVSMRSARSERDGRGRIWLHAVAGALRSVGTERPQRYSLLAVDPTTRQCELLPVGKCTVLAFADDRHVLVLEEDDASGNTRSGECRIVRIDYTTGTRTVLFPRPPATP